ncbi:MAG: DNA methyltransferase [Gammaproteobacteria bacterium]
MTRDRYLGGVVRAAGITPYYADKQGDFVLIEGDCRDVLPQLFTARLSPNLIFADPPYHLSNDGVTCHSGHMISVNKGRWDRSAGVHEDHQFVLSWLTPCLSALAQGGSLWISGTHHVIFSVGYGLQERGAKILNVIVWEKTPRLPI